MIDQKFNNNKPRGGRGNGWIGGGGALIYNSNADGQMTL